METPKRKRHKWLENAMPVDSFPHQVYKVSQCTKCSLVRLHERIGSSYSKAYLIDGKRLDEMPECNN